MGVRTRVIKSGYIFAGRGLASALNTAFIYLGIMDEDTTPHALPISLALLHAIIWKFIILELYKKSQNEHYIIKPEAVERSALRRYAT